MAKLGGFLGRKSDGEPGVKTLWRGYRQLQLLCWCEKLLHRIFDRPWPVAFRDGFLPALNRGLSISRMSGTGSKYPYFRKMFR